MKPEFRTLPVVMVCLAAGFVGCDKREASAPSTVEQKTEPQTPHQRQATEAPPATKTNADDAKTAEKQAVALVRQLGGEVMEDLNTLNKPIIKISLRDRPVNDEGLKALSALEDLEELDLWNCREITDDGLAHIGGLTTLKKLVLWNTPISGRGLEHLVELRQLEVLNVALCAKLTDDGLEPLGRLTDLRELDLASVGGITDAGLSSLEPLKHLRWLNLYNAKITDAGLEQLYGLTELETLYLNGTAVTDDGVAKLKAALPKLREVHR